MGVAAGLHAPRIAAAAAALAALGAHAVAVTLTKLTGLTGTAPNDLTAVYKADLTSRRQLRGDQHRRQQRRLGRVDRQFSGFDLDAIKLSTTDCATAACVTTAVGQSVFDFLSGVIFTPGSQRAPTDPKLFGTGAGGSP